MGIIQLNEELAFAHKVSFPDRNLLNHAGELALDDNFVNRAKDSRDGKLLRQRGVRHAAKQREGR
jgi:predicted subunit of tRNA(5-methylaminomethyl-2-thiouridylate) methyltransferase